MIAKALEHNGAKVYIIGRRLEVLEKAALQAVRQSSNPSEFLLKKREIIPLQGDLTIKEDLSRIVDTITASDGYINLLIANAGISGPGSFSEFTNTYAVNTSAIFFAVIAFLNPLEAGNQRGNVEQKSQVIASSGLGAHNRLAMAGYAYSISKAAVTHMMKQFATSLHLMGLEAIWPIAKLSLEDGIPAGVIPPRGPGMIQDMSGAILYMTSKAGGYLNGNVSSYRRW
ncbi:Short-chain dehydrogenase/reductase SAT3, partial [Lachnellula arida]